MTRERIRGLYGITDGRLQGEALLETTEIALRAGLRLLQYRDKTLEDARRIQEAAALLALCRAYDALLVINDDPRLTRRVGATAIHVGEEDPGIDDLRAFLGPKVLIGVSCYNDLERARRLAATGADYLAFGAVYPSPTKPKARHADLSLFRAARPLGLPLVAIGGITQDTMAEVAAAGADAAAVISALFGAADVAAAVQCLQAPFLWHREERHHDQ
ncbi:thiamine phosphate synthase [Acidithiobacillus sp. AMEEHan]|uniref:thiamine phosphate synthase n=1 Tax=Acidithiobacillus sp. AMEEHan TaxID=2994951 RepID=UPI0027E577D1|nr:thiamine phosphate synthase [Acidithiobacillus sp. AMEEHan]